MAPGDTRRRALANVIHELHPASRPYCFIAYPRRLGATSGRVPED